MTEPNFWRGVRYGLLFAIPGWAVIAGIVLLALTISGRI